MHRVRYKEVDFYEALKGSLKKDLSSFLLRKNACMQCFRSKMIEGDSRED